MAKARKPRQRHLPNTDPEPERIEEIEDAAENYVTARDSRMNMGNVEKERKSDLKDAMKKHKLKKYKSDVGTVEFSVESEENVTVRVEKKPKGETGLDDGEDE